MVQINGCNCCQIEEMKINSALVFNRLKSYFEKGTFKEIPVDKPLQMLDDNHKVVIEWYPTKWYKCVD